MLRRGGFSWKRALGVTSAKRRISRATGIPLTKSGRQRKLGRMASGGGCLLPVLFGVFLITGAYFAAFGLVYVSAATHEGVFPPCTQFESIDWEAYTRARIDVQHTYLTATFSGEQIERTYKTTWRIMPEDDLIRFQSEESSCILLRPDDARNLATALRLLATTPVGEQLSRRGPGWSASTRTSDDGRLTGGLVLINSAMSLSADLPVNQMALFADAIDAALEWGGFGRSRN